jgi:tripartite-type tricarboxylate transporter receptor subunit TctC
LQRSEPIPDESVFGFGGQCEDHARVLMVHVMFFLVGISFGPRPRPVRLIVGWPPGGVADMFGRLMGQLLSERPGQQVVVENRAGAGGNLAVEAVLKAAPDGYTLLMIGSNNAWNVTLYDNLSFNFLRDIAPVASISGGSGVVVVTPSFPVKSIPELIATAKANPGKINMASGGVGSPQQVYGELLKMIAGVDMLHVPYRGGGPALTDLLAGQVQIMFDTMATSIGHIKAASCARWR